MVVNGGSMIDWASVQYSRKVVLKKVGRKKAGN